MDVALVGFSMDAAATADLAAARQLAELALTSCSVDDAAVAALCAGVTGLTALALDRNWRLTDASLQTIGATQR